MLIHSSINSYFSKQEVGYLPILILVLFLTFLFPVHSFSSSDAKKSYRIGVIHSYDEGFAGYQEFNSLLTKRISEKGINAQFKIFYLDCEQYNREEEMAKCRAFIDTMQHWKPDIILLNDDQATYSILECQHPFLRTIPIVFSGVNFPNSTTLGKYSNVTGIWDKPDYLENIRMIEELFGPMRMLFFNDETSLGSLVIRELARQIEHEYPETFNTLNSYINDDFEGNALHSLSPDRAAISYADNSTRPEKSVIQLFNLHTQSTPDALWMVSGLYKYSVFIQTKYDFRIIGIGRMASIPTLSAINEGLGVGRGILGGYVSTQQAITQDAANYIVRLLQGEQIENLPIITSAKEYIIDWEEMQHWGIPIETLPEKYTVINMPFFEKHKQLITIVSFLACLAILITLAILIWLYFHEAKQKQKARLALLEEKEYLTLSLEESKIYPWKFDESLDCFIYDNKFFESLGIPTRTFTLEQMENVIHSKDRAIALYLFNQVRYNKRDKHSFQFRGDFTGEGYKWYEFRHNNVAGIFSKKISVIGLILDIQDFKDRELELTEARDLAAKAELKQSFLANMSHEIRTPLNAIVGFSSLLINEEDLSSEEREIYIETISKNSDQLLSLINDILDISRMESGNMVFTNIIFDLNELVEDLHRSHSLQIPEGVEFIKEVPQKPLYLFCDASRLKQAVSNFINNAIKFTTVGHIKVGYTVHPEKEIVSLFVEDTGKGIPFDEQKMVFERFYKQNEFDQGTGLGLSINQVIVEKLEGHIELMSEPGKGSTFSIVLPYSANDQKHYCKNIIT